MRDVRPGDLIVTMVDSDAVLADSLDGYCAQLDQRVVIQRLDPSDHELMRRITRAHPDVVTVDPAQLEQPEIDAAALITAVLDAVPTTRVIALSLSQDDGAAVRVARAGAVGWVDKAAPVEALLDALYAARRGETRFSARQLSAVVRTVSSCTRSTPHDAERPGSGRDLSAREREILIRVLAGATSRATARELHLSITTVRAYRRRIAVKLGL
jgi:DNA-binding NarL/FixJ family response regulator